LRLFIAAVLLAAVATQAAAADSFCRDLMALAAKAKPGGEPVPFGLRHLSDEMATACGYEEMAEAKALCARIQEAPPLEFIDGYPRRIEDCLRERKARLEVTADGPDSGFNDGRPMITALVGVLPTGERFKLKRVPRDDVLPGIVDYDLEITRP
jgi:hypothetical protein